MYVVDYSKDDQVLSFSTKKEAERFMHSRNFLYYESTATLEQSWYNRGIHVCSHGGFARPKYVVRRYKDGVSKLFITTIVVLYLLQKTVVV